MGLAGIITGTIMLLIGFEGFQRYHCCRAVRQAVWREHMKLGYILMCEQRQPRSLVRDAVGAEAAGFDFAVISDHFLPWLDSEGSAPFAWIVLGAVAERTNRLRLMTMVTCPFLRYQPAVIAQAAATVGCLTDEPFVLGLGEGENLNEHVVGKGWPSPAIRHEMQTESVTIIRRLFSGGQHSFRGRYLTLDRGRLYSLPENPPSLAIAAGGVEAARLAAETDSDLIAVEPNRDLVTAYREPGGTGTRYGQVAVCWAETEEQARKAVVEYQRFSGLGWLVMSELWGPPAFEAATRTIGEEDMAARVPCGPDPGPHLRAIQTFVDAGFDHVAILQVGPDQAGFLRFLEEELRPALSASR